MTAIKVHILCKSTLFGEGVASLIKNQKEIKVGGCGMHPEECLQKEYKTDVLLVCPALYEAHGTSISSLDLKTIIFNVTPDSEVEQAAVLSGVHGILYCHDPSSTLIKAVTTVWNGGYWIKRELLHRLIKVKKENCDEALPQVISVFNLTHREKDVLSAIAKGFSNREVSERLFVSEKTIKTHLGSIFRKLKVNNRIQAILCAKKHELVE